MVLPIGGGRGASVLTWTVPADIVNKVLLDEHVVIGEADRREAERTVGAESPHVVNVIRRDLVSRLPDPHVDAVVIDAPDLEALHPHLVCPERDNRCGGITLTVEHRLPPMVCCEHH